MFRGLFRVVCLVAAWSVWPAAAQPVCTGGAQLIDESLPQGGRWQMCWHDDDRAGIVLNDIYYTAPGAVARKVLADASLAEVYLSANDGSRRTSILADYGLGGLNLMDILVDDCPNGSLLGSAGVNMLCSTIANRGYLYKYYTAQRQGYWLELVSHSQTGEQVWIVRWRFYDDGTIEPAIALAGRLSDLGNDARYGGIIDSDGTIGVALTLRYFWRLDFDIAGNGNNDLLEEINIIPSSSRSTKTMNIATINSETGRNINEDTKRSWRVLDSTIVNADQRPISYHIEPLRTGYRYRGVAALAEDWAQYEMYVTRDRACERFVTANPGTNGCGLGIEDFNDAESLTGGSDLVIWFGLTDALLPHPEQAPVLDARWTGFVMVPRDWMADNSFALLPAEQPYLASLAVMPNWFSPATGEWLR